MMITLDEQFPYPQQVPEEKHKNWNEHFIKSSLRMINILRYIVQNKCVLETRNNIDSDNWTVSTLREFIRFSTHISYGSTTEETGFQDYLKWWRIKTNPTEKEIYNSCHVE